MEVARTIPGLTDLDQRQDFIAHDNPAAAFRFTSDLLRRADALLGATPSAGQ